MKKNILLTGSPGVGKTTIIKKVIEDINKDELNGFYTQEIREGGTRLGFKIITLNGKTGYLAHIKFKTKYKVSKYYVNIEDLERIALPAILDAIENKKFIIIDEIGRMELCSKKFTNIVIEALDSDKIVLGVIQDRDIPFLNSIREREDTEVIKVTPENRDKIPNEVKLKLFNRSIRQ